MSLYPSCPNIDPYRRFSKAERCSPPLSFYTSTRTLTRRTVPLAPRRCLRLFVFVSSALFGLLGVVLFGSGVTIQANSALWTAMGQTETPVYLMMVGGAVITLVSVCGLVCARRNSQGGLVIFLLVKVVSFLLLLVGVGFLGSWMAAVGTSDGQTQTPIVSMDSLTAAVNCSFNLCCNGDSFDDSGGRRGLAGRGGSGLQVAVGGVGGEWEERGVGRRAMAMGGGGGAVAAGGAAGGAAAAAAAAAVVREMGREMGLLQHRRLYGSTHEGTKPPHGGEKKGGEKKAAATKGAGSSDGGDRDGDRAETKRCVESHKCKGNPGKRCCVSAQCGSAAAPSVLKPKTRAALCGPLTAQDLLEGERCNSLDRFESGVSEWVHHYAVPLVAVIGGMLCFLFLDLCFTCCYIRDIGRVAREKKDVAYELTSKTPMTTDQNSTCQDDEYAACV